MSNTIDNNHVEFMIKAGMEAAFQTAVDVNSDTPYDNAAIEYAIRWGKLMQLEIQGGKTLEEIAEPTSHQADVDGITVAMFGFAVALLCQVWIHGEELKVWHNAKYNYNGEGVVNPAVIRIAA